MIKKTLSIAGALVLLATLIGGAIGYEASNAHKGYVDHSVEKVEGKIDLYLINEELADVRKQMYEIRSRWAPKYEEEHGEPYGVIEQLLDFIKDHDRRDADAYEELSERHEELLKDKELAKKKMKGNK